MRTLKISLEINLDDEISARHMNQMISSLQVAVDAFIKTNIPTAYGYTLDADIVELLRRSSKRF